MLTERHNITCRLIMKATEAGSLGGVFCSNGYWQRIPLSLTKPTDLCGIYQQNRPGMALPSPVFYLPLAVLMLH